MDGIHLTKEKKTLSVGLIIDFLFFFVHQFDGVFGELEGVSSQALMTFHFKDNERQFCALKRLLADVPEDAESITILAHKFENPIVEDDVPTDDSVDP